MKNNRDCMHTANERFRVYKLSCLIYTQGNACAAGLIDFFARWHIKKYDVAEKHHDTLDAALYQRHTLKALRTGLLYMYSESTITKAIHYLAREKRIISIHRRPLGTRLDNANYYIFYPQRFNTWLEEEGIAKLEIAKRELQRNPQDDIWMIDDIPYPLDTCDAHTPPLLDDAVTTSHQGDVRDTESGKDISRTETALAAMDTQVVNNQSVHATSPNMPTCQPVHSVSITFATEGLIQYIAAPAATKIEDTPAAVVADATMENSDAQQLPASLQSTDIDTTHNELSHTKVANGLLTNVMVTNSPSMTCLNPSVLFMSKLGHRKIRVTHPNVIRGYPKFTVTITNKIINKKTTLTQPSIHYRKANKPSREVSECIFKKQIKIPLEDVGAHQVVSDPPNHPGYTESRASSASTQAIPNHEVTVTQTSTSPPAEAAASTADELRSAKPEWATASNHSEPQSRCKDNLPHRTQGAQEIAKPTVAATSTTKSDVLDTSSGRVGKLTPADEVIGLQLSARQLNEVRQGIAQLAGEGIVSNPNQLQAEFEFALLNPEVLNRCHHAFSKKLDVMLRLVRDKRWTTPQRMRYATQTKTSQSATSPSSNVVRFDKQMISEQLSNPSEPVPDNAAHRQALHETIRKLEVEITGEKALLNLMQGTENFAALQVVVNQTIAKHEQTLKTCYQQLKSLAPTENLHETRTSGHSVNVRKHSVQPIGDYFASTDPLKRALL